MTDLCCENKMSNRNLGTAEDMEVVSDDWSVGEGRVGGQKQKSVEKSINVPQKLGTPGEHIMVACTIRLDHRRCACPLSVGTICVVQS